MGWYKKDYIRDEDVFKFTIVKPESIVEILSQNDNFSEVVVASSKKKSIVLAKTAEGTVFKVSSINKIEEDDDNYSINLSKYYGDF